MAHFRSRFRRHYSRQSGKLHPLAIVGICLGAAILIALIIGNLLNLWLDDDTYKKLTDGETEAPEAEAPTPSRNVPFTRLYPFTLGDSVSSLSNGAVLPPPALSVSINTPAGDLLYSSAVADYQGTVGNPQIPLVEAMTELTGAVPYVSGVFYPQAPKTVDSELRFAATANEIALLHEFASAGASEILLVGLSFETDEFPATLSYVKAVSEALGNTHVGIALPYSVATSALGWQIIPALAEVTDFITLDMQKEDSASAENLLLDANYYLVQYEMRLLIDSAQTELIGIAEATLSDFQIVTTPPEVPSEEEGETEADVGRPVG